jgi:hypothetical protein
MRNPSDYENKPEPKKVVEYVKVESENVSVFDLREDFEAGLFHHRNSDDTYHAYKSENSMIRDFIKYGLYKKVEREVTWQDKLLEFLDGELSKDKTKIDLIVAVNLDECDFLSMHNEDFIAMCHLVSSMTDNPNKPD